MWVIYRNTVRAALRGRPRWAGSGSRGYAGDIGAVAQVAARRIGCVVIVRRYDPYLQIRVASKSEEGLSVSVRELHVLSRRNRKLLQKTFPRVISE